MGSEDAPLFFIYGEHSRDVDPRFVHVERVSDRRFLHFGHVHQHRHPHLHQLSFWFEADGTYLAGSEAHVLAGECLSWMPAGVVHGFDIAGRCDAIVVSMSADFVGECLRAKENDVLRAALRQPLLARLGEDHAEGLRRDFQEVEREYKFPSWAQSYAIEAHVRLILVTAARFAQSSDPLKPRTAAQPLLGRFLALLEEKFRDHWTIDAYAAGLAATPYLLNRATREGLGMLASEVVRRRVLQEAQRLLLYTMLGVAEVGYALGFEDAAHFGRVFRQAIGEPPARWRARQRAKLGDRTSMP
jgi:AraC family transcriptional activator of pobA